MKRWSNASVIFMVLAHFLSNVSGSKHCFSCKKFSGTAVTFRQKVIFLSILIHFMELFHSAALSTNQYFSFLPWMFVGAGGDPVNTYTSKKFSCTGALFYSAVLHIEWRAGKTHSLDISTQLFPEIQPSLGWSLINIQQHRETLHCRFKTQSGKYLHKSIFSSRC